MNDNIITINYSIPFQSNRGKISLILPEFLPCSVSDFVKVLDIIRNSGTEEAGHVENLDRYIKERVHEWKTRRDKYTDRTEQERKTRRECNAYIKKYVALSEKLADRYGTTAAESGDENTKIKITAATVYALKKFPTDPAARIYTYNGYTLKKAGFIFDVYKSNDTPRERLQEKKNDREKALYIIMLHGTGLQVATAESKNKIPYEITENLIKILKESDNEKKLTAARDAFKKAMTAAGYETEPETENQEQKNQEQEQRTENQEQETQKEVRTVATIRYFSTARNLDDVKKLFKQYARELHPDNGGDPEEFKIMMIDYTNVFNRFRAGLTPEQAKTAGTPEEFSDIINAVINLEGINIELCGSWIWITGNTYPVKDVLKKAGYYFATRKKAWYYHSDGWKKHGRECSLDKIRALHGSVSVAGHGPGNRITAAAV